jgi:hypothetical protein
VMEFGRFTIDSAGLKKGRGYSGFAIGVDRSQGPFRGFLPRKTTPRNLYEATVIAKPP